MGNCRVCPIILHYVDIASERLYIRKAILFPTDLYTLYETLFLRSETKWVLNIKYKLAVSIRLTTISYKNAGVLLQVHVLVKDFTNMLTGLSGMNFSSALFLLLTLR